MPRVTPRQKPLRRTFLKQWRQYRKLSQERAAERIGVDRSLLSRIENGKSPYNQSFLESAAIAYSCEPVDLLIRNPKDKSAIWTLIDGVTKSPPELQRQIQAVVESLMKTGT